MHDETFINNLLHQWWSVLIISNNQPHSSIVLTRTCLVVARRFSLDYLDKHMETTRSFSMNLLEKCLMITMHFLVHLLENHRKLNRCFLIYLLEKRRKSVGILILSFGETPSGHQVFLSPFSREMPCNH